ncbi:hypothetical protein AKJ43_03015 [candidate division MSBL1 archaeon SCGC-AAA261D19]|uniref:Uncharacterized protein n=1 Tax=candidate division MSBL1 archaeon SCGC-AAA261D19 TaxID=1698273 RepID=A0A133V5X3_9EURY|nr:hypothetical protein AKJ43_03015 [candidate division MSBL1 archaeon SCGC-AAA261D19]
MSKAEKLRELENELFQGAPNPEIFADGTNVLAIWECRSADDGKITYRLGVFDKETDAGRFIELSDTHELSLVIERLKEHYSDLMKLEAKEEQLERLKKAIE